MVPARPQEWTMRIYLDVPCLNRPYDDQSQARVRAETQAVLFAFAKFESGEWTLVASEAVEIEVDQTLDQIRRERVREHLSLADDIMPVSPSAVGRAVSLGPLGFKLADALHVAMAEEMDVDILLSCDDRLCRAARRHRARLHVQVANPVDWLREQTHGTNE
jgi:predicted nucleic acid-binding protein